MILAKLIGVPMHDCACCGLIETSVIWQNKSVCSLCREMCAAPFDHEHCTILRDLDATPPPAEDSRA
jgi:hypothetical protein